MTTVIEIALPIAPAPYRETRGQLARFATVGLLNTAVDLLALNLLVWALHIRATPLLLAANAAAYALGATQSFFLNKYWTFRQHRPTTTAEVARFGATTLCGITLNSLLLWVAGEALLPLLGQTTLWANAAKVIAIGGTVLVSYLGMRLWVFARRAPAPLTSVAAQRYQHDQRLALSKALAHHGISVVLPAFNEAAAITMTLAEVSRTLYDWSADYEIIVVDDGSLDGTGALVTEAAVRDPHICVITHPVNLGYGAALADGFAAATKDLTFFMDADGQFAIADLARLLAQIDEADAVLGYRQQRQDSWLRLVNAWGWNALVRLTLGVRVRDLDCAFKLLRTDFLRKYPPETRSALINAELLYKLTRTGATYRQVGVRHLPRQGGRATGAHPRVILRALRDLAYYAPRWRAATVPPALRTTVITQPSTLEHEHR